MSTLSVSSLNGLNEPMSVTQTWPKSRITNEIFIQANQQLNESKALERARAFIADKENRALEGDAKGASDIIRNLCDVLERMDKKRSERKRKSRQSLAGQMHPMGIIREEPHFESMVFSPLSCSRRASSIRSFHDPAEQEPQHHNDAVDVKSVYEERDPLYIRVVPHAIIYVCAIVYIFGGASFFAYIDPYINDLPYYLQVQFAFEVATTVGWGDLTPKTNWSKIACVIYQIIGVPIVFAAMSNAGRLLTEFYTVDFLYLTAVVRGRNPGKTAVHSQLPVLTCINLILVHLFVGVLIFSGLVMDMSVVDSIYFSVITSTTVGFGDIAPKPRNMFECVVCMAYFTVGIVIMAALLVTLSYYFQLFFYGYVNEWLQEWWCRTGSGQRKVTPNGTISSKAMANNV